MHRRVSSAVAAALASAGILLACTAAVAAPTPAPYGAHDAGGFRNILPAAEGSNANGVQIAAFEANGTYPPHNQDQLEMYHGLVYAAPGLKPSQIPSYFKDATFGTLPGDVESTYSPRADVTIVRDRFGVPHIYGSNREGSMFGAGYVAGEDRMFFIDVLRHAARAQLSSFVGGSNLGMDEGIWADTPYTEPELQQQYDRAPELYGAPGALLQQDATNYVAGVNQFISEACLNPNRLPGEYGLINPAESICLPGHGWTVTDVIAIASLIAGQLGNGGGGELDAAITLAMSRSQFGHREGRRIWQDFRSYDDPEAPTTVHGRAFPYTQPPNHAVGLALPDPGSVHFANVLQTASRSAARSSARPGRLPANLLAPLMGHRAASNALLVAGRNTQSGRPIAVMGPQVAYWQPEILMEEDIHAPTTPGLPGIDARGSTFPGTNLYVQLGRGRNYAWSATSAGQDQIDTFAVKLCEPGGGQPTLDSDHYEFDGSCRPFDVLTRNNSWITTAADQSPPGSATLVTLRSALGPVIARATINGQPYAYTKLRSSYFHEVDPSALGIANFNDPRKMQTPQGFFRSACKISYTFNWFYINRDHIAYFNSGANPVRPPGVDPNLPTLGERQYIWRNYDADAHTEDLTPCAAHPHVVDQRFLTSWNNRQAPQYNTGYTPLFRSQLLDERVKRSLAHGHRITLAELIGDMEDAGTVDLRGDLVLPWILRVIARGPVTDPAEQHALDTLSAWVANGAHRRDRDRSGSYDDAEAVRIMDAWWPRIMHAVFEPTLGPALFDRMPFHHDDPAGHLGSAFDSNSYGYVQKDLRHILGAEVRKPYSRVYCGGGDLGVCRARLLAALDDALAHDSDSDIYSGGSCQMAVDQHAADAQMCHDAVSYRAIGAVSQPLEPWINRPTFQQAVEVQGGG